MVGLRTVAPRSGFSTNSSTPVSASRRPTAHCSITRGSKTSSPTDQTDGGSVPGGSSQRQRISFKRRPASST
jgi:hypothetical protein